MNDDPATDPLPDRGAQQRRRRVGLAGHSGDEALARRGLDDPAAIVRVAALGALSRLGALGTDDVVRTLSTGSVAERRRAIDAAPTITGPGSRSLLPATMTAALDDPDPVVVVGAAWYLGERRYRPSVSALSRTATAHTDTRCREAAVAALGAIGDVEGLPAVLAALDDKPTVRRRATVGLAGFDDERVEPALERAAADRDWQVRQAAEELLDDDPALGAELGLEPVPDEDLEVDAQNDKQKRA